MTPISHAPLAPFDVVEAAANEMATRWRTGERPLAEEFFLRNPELQEHPDAALELIAEELALREEFGEAIDAASLVRRFPTLAAQVRALVECQHLLGAKPPPPKFPEVGTWLGDFQLRSELGRGAHGRAYLATQPALGDRAVVLKVGPDASDEYLSLARLQHTHIVPLYSVHDFLALELRALCMPYFGGATLAEIQSRLATIRDRVPTGSDLLDALRREDDGSWPKGPAWSFLARATLPEAVCWIGACLADALQYAHDRGLLHLDVKPSNILIAADGTPMLLDFHLARGPLAAGDPAPAWLGGTPKWMAPEQAAAVEAVRDGDRIAHPLDGRADLFALGVVLADFLRESRVTVSTGLADVLARSTASRAEDRYASAADFATDLRRHLADLPLRGVGNRSVVESWRKWRRRRPYAFPLLMALLALAAASGGLALRTSRTATQAETALRDGRRLHDQQRYPEAVETLRGGERLLDGAPLHTRLREQLQESRNASERAAAGDEFHRFAEQVRRVAASEAIAPESSRAVLRQCRDVWDRRADLVARLTDQPTPEREERWKADVLDVALLIAQMSRNAAPNTSLEVLAEAEKIVGPSAGLLLERARYAEAAGSTELAAEAKRRAASLPERTAWESVVVGRSHLASRNDTAAHEAFTRAVIRDPGSFWANHFLALSCLRLDRPTEAIAALSACVALAPEAAWCRVNRGLAFTHAGQPVAALADFDRAISLDSSLAVAHLGRARANRELHRRDESLADLRRAADAGAPPAEVLYHEALLSLDAADRATAIDKLGQCLTHDPDHVEANDLLVRLIASP